MINFEELVCDFIRTLTPSQQRRIHKGAFLNYVDNEYCDDHYNTMLQELLEKDEKLYLYGKLLLDELEDNYTLNELHQQWLKFVDGYMKGMEDEL